MIRAKDFFVKLLGDAKQDPNAPKKSVTPRVCFEHESRVSSQIPITHCVTPHIFATRFGALGAVIHLQGLTVDMLGCQDINRLHAQWAFALKSLDERLSLLVTTYQHKADTRLSGDYPAGFSADFNRDYQKQFIDSPLLKPDIFLTLLQKAPKINQVSHWQALYARGQSSVEQATQIRLLQQAIDGLLERLADYKPTLLGIKKHQDGEITSDLLSFFSILINGEPQSLRLPMQDLSGYLPQKRLFFGKRVMHYEGVTKVDDQFGAVLSIKLYGASTTPGLLNALMALPFETIATHSFQPIDKSTALEAIRRQGVKLASVGDAAYSQRDELTQASDDVASMRISFGYHHHSLLILNSDPTALENSVAKALKVYADAGIVAVRETLNLENAFWAQMPGNFNAIRRKSLISSENFAGFCSLHTVPTGYVDGNHLGSAVMLAQTRRLTPFYLNLHEKASGRREDLSKGHTTVIGASHSGKTVLLLTLNTLMQKYGIRSFIFDRNRGCEIYVNAMGGVYHGLNPELPTGWNPCQLPDTADNREFLRDFITVLVSRPGVVLAPSDESQIADAVDRMYALPFSDRHLSHLSSFFRLDFSGLSRLSKWLRLPDRSGRPGEYAWIFDNPSDTLNLNHDTMGFDLTAFLGDESTQNKDKVTPVMMYLFKRMEASLDGRLTGVYLDEGWQFLNHPYWIEKLKSYFFTWRKLNAFIVFATQLPDLVAQSPLASTLIQGAATTIFLPNPKADAKSYGEAFKLSAKELAFIQESPVEDRYFLFKQGHLSAVLRIDLRDMPDYLAVLSANQHSLPIFDDMAKTANWLPTFYEKVRAL